MPTATHSRTDFAQTKGQPELATLRSLETLHNAGVLEDGMSIIIKSNLLLQEDPSELSVYVRSLNVTHDDMIHALTVFQPCPETQRRFDAAREAVNRDTRLRECDQALEMAKNTSDSVLEEALARTRDQLISRSAVSWAKLVDTTLSDCEEWGDQWEELKVMASRIDIEDCDGSWVL